MLKFLCLFTLFISFNSYALLTQDNIDTSQSVIHLQNDVYYICNPLKLNPNKRIVGQKNTQLKFGCNGDINDMIEIGSTPLTNNVSQIDSINVNNTVIIMQYGLDPNFKIGDLVALQGKYPDSAGVITGATHSLFSVIKSISGDRIKVTLGDPLNFTMNKTTSLVLYKLNNMNISIDSVNFYYDKCQSSSALKFAIKVNSYSTNVSITNCTFESDMQYPIKDSSGISAGGVTSVNSSININNCSFNKLNGKAVYFENTGNGKIENCIIDSCCNGIELIRTQNEYIKNNKITNGVSHQAGSGIFLSAAYCYDPFFSDKSCNNIIVGNYIDNAAIGVPGSWLGGIHLRFRCKYNVIKNNVVSHNGIGIYLETDNDNNQITNNNCSYNNSDIDASNGYGQGIELDWLNDNNYIAYNNCSFNGGSSPGDGFGIEIRNSSYSRGLSDGFVDNKFNMITNNQCKNNKNVGLVLLGTGTIATGNIVKNNMQGGDGYLTDSLGIRAEVRIQADNVLFDNNIIEGGNLYLNSSPKYNYNVLHIGKCKNVTIQNNLITANYYSESAITLQRTNDPSIADTNVFIKNNTINGGHSRGFYFNIISEVRHLDIVNNIFNAGANGWYEIFANKPHGYQIDASNTRNNQSVNYSISGGTTQY